jgi:hypothetical protein
MPKIRRRDLPPTLLDHLLERIRSREISADQLGELATWLDTEPEVSTGKWFKRFPGMIVCGEGELVKTFLRTGQAPIGEELRWCRAKVENHRLTPFGPQASNRLLNSYFLPCRNHRPTPFSAPIIALSVAPTH